MESEALDYRVNEVYDYLGLQERLSKAFIKEVFLCTSLFDKKQQDYGATNIANFGEFGVIVRMNDKFSRLQNLMTKGRKPKNEPVVDSLRDIANYAVIALMLRKGTWT